MSNWLLLLLRTMKAEVEQTAPAVARALFQHHRLIYLCGPDQVLHPCATGLLFGAGALRFLVTAAHVLDENFFRSENDFCDLVTYGQGEAVIFRGESFRTTIPNGRTRNDDPLDVGFIRLDAETVAQIGEDRFLSPANVDLNDTGAFPALYGALGYPARHNQTIEPGNEFQNNPFAFSYTAQLRSAQEHEALGISMASHLLLAASNNKGRRAAGFKAKIPDLHGMSGGGLWRYTEYGQVANTRAPCLLGVLIAHRRRTGNILAARMGLLFEGLRRAYPELNEFLPHTTLADITVQMVTGPAPLP
jgi:hypothetical protein